MIEHKHTTQLGKWLAGSENSEVYFCDESQVVSVCLHYMTLRFEAGAFRELLGMLGYAQSEIERINRGAFRVESHMSVGPFDGSIH